MNNNENIVKPKFTQARFTPSAARTGTFAPRDGSRPQYGSKPQYRRTNTPYNAEPSLPTYTVLRRFVCRTNAGGVIRRTNIITAVGDAKLHKIGVGSGKAATYQNASKQAETNAIRNLRFAKILSLKNNTVKTVEQSTIFDGYGLKLIIKQVNKPNLLCANKAIREICKLIGINAINVKVIAKSGAIQNQVYAFIDAITQMESPKDVAYRLNKPVSEILERNKIYKGL